MRAMALAVAVASACGPEAPDSWTITGDGGPADTEAIIDLVRQEAPCDPGPWGGTIAFVPEYAPCGGLESAAGCAWEDEAGPHVWAVVHPLGTVPSAEMVLIHELGHIAFGRCGGELEEQSRAHSAEFMAWVSWTYMAYQAASRAGA